MDLTDIDGTRTTPYKSTVFDEAPGLAYNREIPTVTKQEYNLDKVEICLLHPPSCTNEPGSCTTTPCAKKFFRNDRSCPSNEQKYDPSHYDGLTYEWPTPIALP